MINLGEHSGSSNLLDMRWRDINIYWSMLIDRLHIEWAEVANEHTRPILSYKNLYKEILIHIHLTDINYTVNISYIGGEKKTFVGELHGSYKKIKFFDPMKHDVSLLSYIYDLIKVRSL